MRYYRDKSWTLESYFKNDGYIALTKLVKNTSKGRHAGKASVSALERALRDASDIILILDENFAVDEIHVSDAKNSLGDLDHWKGQNIEALLTEESKPKLKKRLSGLSKKDQTPSTFIELNHVDNGEREFPVRYTIHPTEDAERIILIGRDLRSTAEVQQQLVRAQLALEKEYEKHRDFDTRYRVLRDNLNEAIIFVDASNGRILDTNLLAAKLFNVESNGLIGQSINSVLKNIKRRSALEHLLNAATEKDPMPMAAKTAQTGETLKIHPTLFRSAGDMMLLCRLDIGERDASEAEQLTSALGMLFRTGSDAIVFTDSSGEIRHANEEFLRLCDVVHLSDLKEKMLGDFLLRGSIDQKILLETTVQTGRIKTFSTKLKSAHGTETEVEIASCHLNEEPNPYFGFVLRNRSQTQAIREREGSEKATHNAMELVGTAPLKELVAATADVVEKMCIETAVKLTDNNRVAAAELLGLSRQSFYVRLRKYDLLRKDEE